MTEKQNIQLPAIFDSANRKKDRSLGLRLTTTYEVTNLDFAAIDRLVGTTGYVLFSANRFSDADIPTEEAPSDSKKPSQRLRAVLFLAWKQTEDGSEPFDSYYRRRMEAAIEKVKRELD